MIQIFKDLHPRLIFFAAAQCFLAESVDYCMTVINVPEAVLKEFICRAIFHTYHSDLTEAQLAWLWEERRVAAPTAGALLGSALLGYLSSNFGRRDTVMIWNNLILLMSSALQLMAAPLNSYELLIFGRLLAGVCVGICCLVPVYLAECSPDSCRGLISTSSSVGRALWDCMGPILGLHSILGTKRGWSYLLAVPALPGVLHLALTPLFPKSPKFLYISEKDYSAAVDSVHFYHGPNADMDVIMAEYECEAKLSQETARSGTKPTFWTILKTPHLCWPLVICSVTGISSDLGGSDITSQYSTEILKQIGMTGNQAATGTILTMLPPVLLSAVAPVLIEQIGRRKIVFLGIFCGIVAISLLFIASFVADKDLRFGFALTGVAASYIGTYVGMGTVPAFLPGEMAPEGSRSITAAVTAFASWFPSAVILLVFPASNRFFGSYSYLPFVVLGIGCLVFLYFFMPETKNRPVNEIVERWVCRDSRNSEPHTEFSPLLHS